MAKDNYNLNEQIVNQFKPFYINAFLLKSLSPCPANTPANFVENQIEDYCSKSGKKYTEIKTPERLVRYYDSLPVSYWKDNINYVFENQEEVKNDLDMQNTLYDSTKIKGLENMLNSNPYFKTKYPIELVANYNKDVVASIFSNNDSTVMVVLDLSYFLATNAALYKQIIDNGYTVQLL
jgi:hypothetical protein